jgi:hypothetical protein
VIIANGLWLFIFVMLMTRLYLFPGAPSSAAKGRTASRS